MDFWLVFHAFYTIVTWRRSGILFKNLQHKIEPEALISPNSFQHSGRRLIQSISELTKFYFTNSERYTKNYRMMNSI